ncbi:MAG TPA: 5-(carboxyamino)imidazole ribonucleotide synthase [Myxococcaceae bacterium]|nr:5-(carboxyamino)imidazole ribonucleotide synthase [Myxococcaceae bacterium]
MTPILPGATLGMVGGGQLGRMTALAARAMGYRVVALDPSADCAIAPVADRVVVADFQDATAIEGFAQLCDVVTLEIEKVSPEGLRRAAQHCPVRPSAEVIATIQDKGEQKEWLARAGFPVGPFRRAASKQALRSALAELGPDCFVKAARGGYDGRSQVRVRASPDSSDDAESAWDALGGVPCVVEAAVALEAELSVLVARNDAGEVAVYLPALNHHANQVLDWSVWPGGFAPGVAQEAQALARRLAEGLNVQGLLAAELFLAHGGKLLVNELAPRPHNSFHATEVGCLTSQFEQLVRAVTGLPLGSVEMARPAAMANLLGEVWGANPSLSPDFVSALKVPETRLHLYGKGQPRPGRKMGHLSATGATAEEALERVRTARARLSEVAMGKPTG